MKHFFEFILYLLSRFLLSLRYQIELKGQENLRTYNFSKSSGTVFLANHPAEIDPLILISVLWKPFKPHPVAIEYLFRKPLIGNILRFIGAISVPNFDTFSNSYKRKQIDKTYEKIYQYLDDKNNLLIYPAGSLKRGPEEIIGGASGIHTILTARPQVNIVLVRATGLWGSSFSRALTGKTPDLFQAFANGFKVLLKNFIFFAPRRKVIIEISPPPADFPGKVGRRELNRYLENWYNRDGPEPLKLVSFSRFKKIYPQVQEKIIQEEVSLDSVPEETKQKIIEEITKLSRVSNVKITTDSHLSQDLGLDSLDIAQLVVFLKDHFGLTTLNASDLATVGSVLAFAAKLKKAKTDDEEKEKKTNLWEKEKNRPEAYYPDGETVPELFFKTCERMGRFIACVDQTTGKISYHRLKMGTLLLAEAVKKLPGDRIGIMMPASIAVNALIIATILAKKTPVMINWTLGERNLKAVAVQSGIQKTLSSWQFIDRLDNIELTGIDDNIILVEDLRSHFSLLDKLKALYRSQKGLRSLLKLFGVNQMQAEETAVILFTSGTESFPKAVPLTHKNLITNQRGAYSIAHLQTSDVMLGSLPPFHSFGFSVTGLLPLLAGLRVAYSPNPTDGKRIAEAIERWKVTILCMAPTFLKNLLRVANPKQLQTLRVVVTGAEKTAAELFCKLTELNDHALLIEGYGITECAPILTLNPPDQPTKGVGIPLPNIEIKIVHPETLHPLPIGEQGLILTRGPNVFKGYLGSKNASPFVEVDGKTWYQTGDLGFIDEKNYLTLSGRLKRFVKIGGEMVSLTAVEETIQQGVKQKGWEHDSELPILAVSALEVEGKKSEMYLFTTLDTSLDEINNILRDSGMSNIIKIRAIKKLPSIPLLGSGKIDYQRLASML